MIILYAFIALGALCLISLIVWSWRSRGAQPASQSRRYLDPEPLKQAVAGIERFDKYLETKDPEAAATLREASILPQEDGDNAVYPGEARSLDELTPQEYSRVVAAEEISDAIPKEASLPELIKKTHLATKEHPNLITGEDRDVVLLEVLRRKLNYRDYWRLVKGFIEKRSGTPVAGAVSSRVRGPLFRAARSSRGPVVRDYVVVDGSYYATVLDASDGRFLVKYEGDGFADEWIELDRIG